MIKEHSISFTFKLYQQFLHEPFLKVVRYGHEDLLTWILDNYVFDINMKNVNGNTLLHIAALEGRSRCCSLLLHYQPDINTRNNSGQTPLDIAIQLDLKNTKQILLEHRSRQSDDEQIVSFWFQFYVLLLTTINPTSSIFIHNS